MILRKGAVSAQKCEKLLIPINMRDGSLVCIGKGNEDWNCSAPHGAGRVMSRMKAKKELNLADFKAEMKGIWSSTVNKSTLDEAPMACNVVKELPENCVAIEDSPNGIKSAIAAGMKTIMIPDKIPVTEEINKICYRVLKNLEELTKIF